MTIEELRAIQQRDRLQGLGSLLSEAKQRFSDAAVLLEMDTPVLEGLRHRYATERIDLSLLFAMYDELAGRYIQQHFTPQLDLLNPAEMRQDVLWSKYFYHKLKPALMESNDVIRNILRATTLLPCKYPDEASLALVLHCQEMTMPDTLPLWGSSPLLLVDNHGKRSRPLLGIPAIL